MGSPAMAAASESTPGTAAACMSTRRRRRSASAWVEVLIVATVRIPIRWPTTVGLHGMCKTSTGKGMARLTDRLEGNAAGAFFVDSSCIDCDLCRQIAPSVFGRSDAHEQSVVVRQPADVQDRTRAAMALVACPTSSIGGADAAAVREASRLYPEPIATLRSSGDG